MIKYLVFAVIIGTIGVLVFRRDVKNNVCKTFEDYYSDRDSNSNCYHNPDVELTVPEIITRHGYPVEVHQVTTEDGYILSVFRIPYGKGHNINGTQVRKPVFIQHGLAYKSVSFINRGQKSLGFILANEGYDVWIGNFRGSVYSPNHTHFSQNDKKYWDFSFHEHGLYDLPAQLALVRRITKQKILYIGYSMGTTSMYVLGSRYPDVSRDTISYFINFAPAVFMKNMQSAASSIINLWPTLKPIIDKLTNGKMSLAIPLPNDVLKMLCFPYPFQMKACNILEMLLFGFSYEQLDPETLPITFLQNQDWTALKSFDHYMQLSISDDFQQYDYGTKEDNLKVYGTETPPSYDLTKINIPVYLICANNDLSIAKQNVEKLYKMLPTKVKTHGIYVIKDDAFNHMDFVLGKDVVPLLYDHVVDFLRSL